MATDFEGHTHQQLLAMIASANAETLKTRGAQLADAAKVIMEIGEDLKDYRVTGWEGESFTAFQDWVSRTGNATLHLSKYSAESGEQMTLASQVVIEVKANIAGLRHCGGREPQGGPGVPQRPGLAADGAAGELQAQR